MTHLLETKNLNVSFGEHQVIKDVNLTVQKESSFLLLGQMVRGRQRYLIY